MIYNEYLFNSKNCDLLSNSCLLLADEVTRRFTPWMDTWEQDHMTFANGSTSTKLYEAYNVFLSPLPGFAELYSLVVDYFKSKQPNYKNYAIAGWVNVYQKGGYLDWHKHSSSLVEHDNRWHGYVCINAEPSKTLYKNEQNLVETIDNKNGFITLSPAGMCHRTTPWTDQKQPRITIAFDFILRDQIDPMHFTRWIPII